MSLFVGRHRELALLGQLREKRTASLVVVRGRRRIGKSRLAEEFGGEFARCFTFTGLSPDAGVTAGAQRQDFARQLHQQLNAPSPTPDDWSDLLWHLALHCQQGPVLIVLDEITWLGGRDPTFLAKIKTAWDLHFSKNPRLILLLSGSISSWIEANILSSSGFLGRISLDLVLDELPLDACAKFWGAHQSRVSAYEKLKCLAVTGGVPRYIEEILPHRPAEENLQRLCFDRAGFLFNEFDRIFADLFARRSATYRQIVTRLADGPAEAAEIYRALDVSRGGVISTYLDDLTQAGFIARDYTWSLKTGAPSRLSRYRLKDNYLRFYLKHIAPNQARIQRGTCPLPRGWHGILGLQFENLVLGNRRALQALLSIEPADVIYDNPFFQRPTQRQPGCQIDYLIQTRFDTLYVCEIKFSRSPIGSDVLAEVQQKIDRLRMPKHISCRPILVHVNGVAGAVLDSDLFAQVVDFGAGL